MPQMSPYNWLLIMMLILMLIYILMAFLNFFFKKKNITMKKLKKILKSWKW